MKQSEITDFQKKSAKDLLVIAIATIIPLVIYLFFENEWKVLARNEDVNIWLRYFPIVMLAYGLSGLGCTIVMIYRKELFSLYGLVRKGFFSTILLSIVVFIPHFLFLLCTDDINGYSPMQGTVITDSILKLSFPQNILGMIGIFLVWGFFEGFTYVVISKKINDCFPCRHKWLNWGAILCAVLCILLHGMIGFDIKSLFEAATTFILIYGILVIKEYTENAWGCIFVFFFLWNAF